MKSTKTKSSKNGSAHSKRRFLIERTSSNKQDSVMDVSGLNDADYGSRMSFTSPKNLAQSFAGLELSSRNGCLLGAEDPTNGQFARQLYKGFNT